MLYTVDVGNHSTGEVRIVGGVVNEEWNVFGIPFLAKIDANGQMSDHAIFQVPGGGQITGVSVNPDETITALGYNFNTGWRSWFVLHLDANLDTIWTRAYHQVPAGTSGQIARLADGSFALVGGSTMSNQGNDAGVMRIDGSGNLLWSKVFATSSEEFGEAVTICSNGDIIIAGYGYDPQTFVSKVFAIRMDLDGNVAWNKVYETDEWDEVKDVIELSDGNIAIAGLQQSPANGFNSASCIKLDANGNVIWSNMYSSGYVDEAYSVSESGDGSLVLTGRRIPPNSQIHQALIFQIDAAGNMDWARIYADSNFYAESNAAVASQGGYLMVGNSTSLSSGTTNALIVQTDSLGWSCNGADITPLFTRYDNPLATHPSLNDLAGGLAWNTTITDTLQTPTVHVYCGPVSVEEQEQNLQANVYPNPTQNVLNIQFETKGQATVELFSSDGRLMAQKRA